MTWTAIVPLKAAGDRKRRLSASLSGEERQALSNLMFRHVTDVLATHSRIDTLLVLCDRPPDGWRGEVAPDEGTGLNAELRKLVVLRRPGPLLVIHADLPLLTGDDVSALLDQASGGAAIGPDRHGSGTNGLALRNPGDVEFAFGADSLGRHLSILGERARIVSRPGIGLDIDTPADLEQAEALGFRFSARAGISA